LTPPGEAARAADLVRTTVWTVPPLGAAIASQWVADGTAAELVAARHREAEARQALAERVLPSAWRRQTAPSSMHLWLHLPRGLRADEAARRALSAGVKIAPGSAFAVGQSPNAVRLSLGSPEQQDTLERALHVLSATLLR